MLKKPVADPPGTQPPPPSSRLISVRGFAKLLLMDAITQDADLNGAQITNTNLSAAQFDDVNLEAAQFTNVNLTGVRFEDVNLSGSFFSNANFAYVTIEDANYEGMRLDGILVSDLLKTYRAQHPESA